MRLALIGGGDHGLRALASAVTQLPGWSIVAVADPDPGARARAAIALPQALLHADHESLLERTDGIDLIVVATPPAATAAVAKAALTSNAAILIEKPGALVAADLETIPTARVPFVTCAYSYRFHPTVIAFRAALPRVGSVARLELCFTAPMNAEGTWRASRESGGGALRDLGTHLLDFARQALGVPLTFAHGTIRSVKSGDDDVTLEFTAGTARVLLRCAYHGAPVFRLVAVGERGQLHADLWSMTTPARGWFEMLSSKVRTKLPGPLRPHAALFKSRMETLLAAVAPRTTNAPASIANAAAILRLVEAAEQRSHHE